MTAPGRLGRAYVEIVGDFDKFRGETTTKLNAALRDVGRNAKFDDLEDAAARAGKQSASAFHKSFDQDLRNGFRRTALNVGEEFVEVFDSPRNRSRIGSSITRLGRFASAALGGAFSFFGAGTKGFGEFVQTFAKGSGLLESLGFAFTKAGSGIGSFLITLGAAFIVVPTILGAIFTLISQLVGLLGLLNALPAAGAVAVGAILPLIAAFEGMGDAIGAVLSRDPDKIAEALKKLTPSARAFVKEFQGLLPIFTEIRKAAQEAFFAPILGELSNFFKLVGTGTIATGFANVARSIGNLVAHLITLGTMPGFQKLAASLFGNKEERGAIARFFEILGPALNRTFDALARLATTSMETALGFVERLLNGIASFFESLADPEKGKEFNDFLLSAEETAKSIMALLGELLGLFLDMFEETDEGGRKFLDDITAALADLREWLKSPEGKEGLKAMIDFANLFAQTLIQVGKILGGVIEQLITIRKFLGLPGIVTGEAVKAAGVYTARGGYKPMAAGGVVDRPTFALVGEAGREAIVPLNDPNRAMQVMADAGLLPLAESMAGGGHITVQVFLGTAEITDILDTRVRRGLNNVARSLAAGPRRG